MIRALWTAGTGMIAQQTNIDNISNNLANVNTIGYKKVRAEFEDLLYQTLRAPGNSSLRTSGQLPTGLQIGLGARLAATNRLFSQGSFQQTGNPLDLTIQGDGFFQVLLPDGKIAYTRSGNFKVDGEGNLLNNEGYYVQPEVNIPDGSTNLSIAQDGRITVVLPGETTPEEIGRIELVRFINPAGLNAIGENLFLQSSASGEPVTATPGTEGVGTIIQGCLEMSNVQVVEEMVNMIVAQRAYDVNSKAVLASDEMLQVANGLKR
ncbi:MAG: flagellar basal-body rod protein FlgG [Firmicutes bacterium]|nr:flagellar basal-body rod protein FlgG [Bacillota bacterium]